MVFVRNSTKQHRFFAAVMIVTIFAFLSGCATSGKRSSIQQPAAPELKLKTKELLPASAEQTSTGAFVREGLAALDQGKLDEAGHAFRAALQLQPDNSYLHFLNGLIYHLQARRGDGTKYELAELGYGFALDHDANNWLATYQLGRVHSEKRNFRSAQDYFSKALLLEPDNVNIYHDLAVASYYAGDIATAKAAVKEAYKRNPSDPQIIHSAAVIMAAADDLEGAQEVYEDLKNMPHEDTTLLERVKKNVDRWLEFHARADQSEDEKAEPEEVSGEEETPGEEEAFMEEEVPEEEGEVLEQEADTQADRMILVELVILRTDESLSTSKGSNLLRLLTGSFSLASVYENVDTKDNKNPAASTDVTTKTLTKNFSFPTLTYNLNIANAGDSQSDILARPTVLVKDGQESEFALVEEQMFTVRGQESGSLERIEAGIKCTITPTFISDDRFSLAIYGEASLFQPTAALVGTFQEAVKISKATTRATAVLSYDQTMILSGFNQRTLNKSNSGVPFLRDIPGLQYFFSEKTTTKRQTSIMLLITPRRPAYATTTGPPIRQGPPPPGAAGETTDLPSLDELMRLRPKVFQNYMGLRIMFDHIERSSEFYRQFRTGDVRFDRWDTNASVRNLVKQTLGFLYF